MHACMHERVEREGERERTNCQQQQQQHRTSYYI
jgi:hypothetical protein